MGCPQATLKEGGVVWEDDGTLRWQLPVRPSKEVWFQALRAFVRGFPPQGRPLIMVVPLLP